MAKKKEETESVNQGELPAGVVALFGEFAEMPEGTIQPIVETPVVEGEKESETAQRITTDSSGQTFDPALHLADKDGNPTRRPDGTFRKRPGRKPGAQQSAINVTQPATGAQEGINRAINPPICDPAAAKRAAKSSAAIMFMAGMMIDAEEFAPIVDKSIGFDEREVTEFAFENYYLQKGITDIPPSIALAIAIGGYGARRLQMPRTGGKFKLLIDWILGKR